MKRILGLLLVAIFFSVNAAKAQFTIESENKEAKQKVDFKPIDLKPMNVATDYFSEAREKAERKRIRQERNALSMTFKLQGSMTAYNEAWGGDNAMSLLGIFSFSHTYKKDLFSIATSGEARMGYNRINVEVPGEGEGADPVMKGIWFKNNDQFWLQTRPGRKMNDHWLYTLSARIDSRLGNIYKSRTAQEKSDITKAFMAPAEVSISLGFTYANNSKTWPLTLSLNALSSNGTLVFNEDLRKMYVEKEATSYFGVDIDKHAIFSGGSQIQLDMNHKWGKKGWLTYKTQLISYYGWITNVMSLSKIKAYSKYLEDLEAWEAAGSIKEDKPASVPRYEMLHPTVGWKNWITIKLSNYISTDLYYELQYNKAQNTAVRMWSSLTLGLTYTFNSK